MLLEAAQATLPDHKHLTQALRAARENLTESRRVVGALRPGELDEVRPAGGPAAAVRPACPTRPASRRTP